MMRKTIAVIGAGISGLAFAWYLSKCCPEHRCILLEKESYAGGHMQSVKMDFGIVEEGPRIFSRSRSEKLLHLIEDVGLGQEIMFSPKCAENRYLLVRGKLHKASRVLVYPLLCALIREWYQPKVYDEESVWDFAKRRFGIVIAEGLFDPMMRGIYAGDCRQLSVESCLSTWKQWERHWGSVSLGYLMTRRQKKNGGLFSLYRGMRSLVDAIHARIPYEILCEEQVQSVTRHHNIWRIHTQKQSLSVDDVVFATPSFIAAHILQSIIPSVAHHLRSIPYASVTTAHVQFAKQVLSQKGFGYLIPSCEKEAILGAFFDSCIFPMQGTERGSRLTFMMRGVDGKDPEAVVRDSLSRHLGIHDMWTNIHIKKIDKAIPQLVVGHQLRIKNIRQQLPEGIHLIGNYLDGVSVNAAIQTARETAYHFV